MRAVNLIPVEQRAGQPVGAGRSNGAAYAVIVLIAGLAAMAYVYGRADHQLSTRRAEAASFAARAQQEQAAVERLAPYTSFVAQREARTQAVESLIDSRFDWAHAFHEFGRVLPAGVSVSSLSGSAGTSSSDASASAAAGSSVTSATPPGTVPSFSLSGCATSQPTVALTLQRLRLIDGVKEVTLNSSSSGGRSSGGSAQGASSGGCSAEDPEFSVSIVFEPLPSTAAVAAVAKTVSNQSSDGSTTTAGAAR
jgi:Tfp pilus assembly protein PilN